MILAVQDEGKDAGQSKPREFTGSLVKIEYQSFYNIISPADVEELDC